MLPYKQSRWAWTNAVYYGDPRHHGEDPLVFQEHRTPRHADGPTALAISKRPGHPLARPGHYLEEDADPQSRSANTPTSRAAWRRRLSRVHSATPGVTRALARSATSTALRPLPHSRRSSTRCRNPRSSTVRTIINFRKIERSLRLSSASSVITLWCTHLVALKEVNQDRLSLSQVIDPDVRVDEDSHTRSRLRGAASAAESLPPSAASCRPVSMRTRSSTASLINTDRSLIPVRTAAHASNSSSTSIVIRIESSSTRIGLDLHNGRCAAQNLSARVHYPQQQLSATSSHDPATASS